jgi:hypothetical protein
MILLLLLRYFAWGLTPHRRREEHCADGRLFYQCNTTVPLWIGKIAAIGIYSTALAVEEPEADTIR